jgi:adenylate cyclase
MPTEIERKFLVRDSAFLEKLQGIHYRQGFLSTDPGRTVRIRIGGDKAFLTVKGPTTGFSRSEFEYPIPLDEAGVMLNRLCLRPLIEKTRYKLPHAGLVWEIDVFHIENEGLILAEVELEREDQLVDLPPWTGQEVTGDARYYNSHLVAHPYTTWPGYNPPALFTEAR